MKPSADDAARVVERVVELVVESEAIVGDGGFLKIRRLRLRNRRADGSLSAHYLSDSIVRPYGQDAIVVAIYARAADGGVRVLVRDGLRPAIVFGRDAYAAPLPEAPPTLTLTELVAGIVEVGDVGVGGLRARAAHEVDEEAGFAVAADAIAILGAGLYASPGATVEKFYFAAVAVDPATQHALTGDGSPMEDGATTRWLAIDDAIAACVRGEIADLKTELGLRRLRDHLS